MGRVKLSVSLPAELAQAITATGENRSAFIAEAVRRELRRRERAALVACLQQPHPKTRAWAAELDALSAPLPDEDYSDLVDPEAVEPFIWQPEE